MTFNKFNHSPIQLVRTIENRFSESVINVKNFNHCIAVPGKHTFYVQPTSIEGPDPTVLTPSTRFL